MKFFRHYIVAVHHFTRMPLSVELGQWAGAEALAARPRDVYWPAVGWCVGLVACVTFAAVGLLLHGNAFAPLTAAVASTMATALLTRAFHEEGLANFADGLRTPTLPGLGTFGVLALVLVMLAKVSLLAILAGHSPAAVLLALLCAHVVTRFWPLILVRTLPPGLAPDSRAAFISGPITLRDLALAAAWCLPALAAAVAVRGAPFAVLALLFSGAAMWGMKMILQSRSKGPTADALGATQQVCEVGFYLGAAIAWGAG